jgi:hypothetical protein
MGFWVREIGNWRRDHEDLVSRRLTKRKLSERLANRTIFTKEKGLPKEQMHHSRSAKHPRRFLARVEEGKPFCLADIEHIVGLPPQEPGRGEPWFGLLVMGQALELTSG